MAGISCAGLDDLEKLVRGLGKTASEAKQIAKACIDEAAPVMESAYRSALASVEYGPNSTGSASASVSLYGTKENSLGIYNVARPVGKDAKGTRNGEKAALLEYGTANMPARPWVNRAHHAAEKPCTEIVKKRLEEEVKRRIE